MKKSQRHAAIIEAIQKQSVHTQEELQERLSAMGCITTQATISRDIKDLKIVKAADADGGYRYSVSVPEDGSLAPKLKTIFTETVYKADFAGNMVVLKTYAGMGNAAGAAVDSMKLEGVVGTLAGDDTLFIVARTPETAERICFDLGQILKN